MNEEKKQRGRPRLTPEQREINRMAANRRKEEWRKTSGYNKKKRERMYFPPVRIHRDMKPILDHLVTETGYSINRLFLSAVEEKYSVILHKQDYDVNDDKST